MTQGKPVLQAVLAALGATCVALITTRLNDSPSLVLIAAALAAAVPVLINAGTPSGLALGVGVTALALGVTYVGFTAASPDTLAGSRSLRKSVGVTPQGTTQTTLPTENVNVPDVVDKPYAEAVHTLEEADLKAERKDVELSEHPQGVVVDQDPDAEESAEKGSTVTLSVTPIAVPDVRNQTEADARSQLEAFTVESNPKEVIDPTKDGLVIDESPVETMVAPGTTIVLTIGTFTE
jgi:PASTA domain